MGYKKGAGLNIKEQNIYTRNKAAVFLFVCIYRHKAFGGKVLMMT